jgi:hypothetical protein
VAATDGIARIQKVNMVRKTRLVRALMQAQDSEREANAARAAAEAAKQRQESSLKSAQDSFRADPACEQGRIWQAICNDRLAAAQEVETDATQSAAIAKEVVKNEARAVRNHDLKATKIDDYARLKKREAARLQEIRDEDELTPGVKGRRL